MRLDENYWFVQEGTFREDIYYANDNLFTSEDRGPPAPSAIRSIGQVGKRPLYVPPRPKGGRPKRRKGGNSLCCLGITGRNQTQNSIALHEVDNERQPLLQVSLPPSLSSQSL